LFIVNKPTCRQAIRSNFYLTSDGFTKKHVDEWDVENEKR